MKHFFYKLILYPLISLTFFGCATRGNYPEPEIPSAQALSKLDETSHTIPESIRITSKIDYVDEINGKRVVGQDLILSAQTPGSMRITISAFDKAISTLVTDGTGFSLIDVTQNVYVTGLATPDNISRILPVYLSGMDLYRVIFGDYPKDELAADAYQNQTFQWDPAKGGYRRTLMLDNGLREDIFYSWPSGDIFQIQVSSNNKEVYTYEATDFKSYTSEEKTYRFPQTILFRLPEQKTDVRLRIEKRDLNVEFSPAVFRLPPPAGARIIVLTQDIEDDSLSQDTQNNTPEVAESVPAEVSVSPQDTAETVSSELKNPMDTETTAQPPEQEGSAPPAGSE